jgi:hypothetical protein
MAYTLQGQALTVVDQLPAGARKLAASLRKAPGAEAGAMEKVQQAADELQGSEKSAAPKGVTRVQVEQPGFQASSFVWSTSIGLASTANHNRNDCRRRRRFTPDHDPGGFAADTRSDEPRVLHESGRNLCRPAVLELDLGHVARRPNGDGD